MTNFAAATYEFLVTTSAIREAKSSMGSEAATQAVKIDFRVE
jgi:hypothetical protein